MGYTHYWYFKKQPTKASYEAVLKECNFICRSYSKQFGGLSGYSAHSTKDYEGLLVNGSGENAHEHLVFRKYSEFDSTNFCKTARKPYDIVVTACLALIAKRLPSIQITSDGDAKDWLAGCLLASYLTGEFIPVPANIAKPLDVGSLANLESALLLFSDQTDTVKAISRFKKPAKKRKTATKAS